MRMASVTETVQVLLMLIQVQYANTEIHVTLRDTEAVVGQQTYLNCSTSIRDKEILWYHYPVGAHESNYIYIMDQLQPRYKNRFQLQIYNETGEFNLVIQRVEACDAGRYICQEDGDQGQHKVAELIVLDANPICASSMKEDGVIGNNSCDVKPEDLQLLCSITYHGNIPPILEWRNAGEADTISEGINQEISAYNVTSILKISGIHIKDGSSFICQTRRSSTEQYRCNSDIIKIIYVFNNFTSTQAVVGETKTCLANSSQPCVYRWKWSDDNNEETASDNAMIKFEKPGSYICETECKIRQKICSFEAKLVHVSSLSQTSELETSTAFYHSIIIIVATSLLTAAVSGLVMYFVLYRCSSQKHLTAESSEESVQLLPRLEINGLTMLDDDLYISRIHRADIEVYDSINFAFKRQWRIQDLQNPTDLICGDKNLYIFDSKDLGQDCEIFRVTASGELQSKWSTGNNWGTISASNDSHVILTAFPSNRLMEYSSDGQLLHQIVLTGADILNPRHAIKLANGEYVVCYCRFDLPHHRVCVVRVHNTDNEEVINVGKNDVVKTFVGERGSSSVEMDVPMRLDIGANGFIYVADHRNGRILMLNSDLNPVKELVSARKHGLRRPRRLYLDEAKNRLLVSDHVRVLVCQLDTNRNQWYDIKPANKHELHVVNINGN